MEQIIFKNSAGKTVTLGDNAPFILTKIDGTGAVGTNIYTQKSPNRDGVSYIGNTLEPRPISLKIKILAENEVDMVNKRSQLLNTFNPKLGQGELTYRLGNITRKVSALPEIAPVFPESEESRNFKDTMQDCLIQLYCPNPYWQDIEESKTDISTETGNFEFPLEIPLEGLELSIRTISFITNLYNDGDVDTPIKVRLKATGTVINPIIENLDTGEFIRVKRSLETGETLEINTAFGNKRVEVIQPNGTRENVFHYIDYKSTFFSLSDGDNTIKYDAEVGENNLDVSIYYTPNYLGV